MTQPGREGEDAAEVLVVAEARLDPDRHERPGLCRRSGAPDPARRTGRCPAHSRASSRRGTGWRRPGRSATSGLWPVSRSRPKPGGMSDGQAKLAGAQPAVDFGLAAQRRLLAEVARAREALDQLPALGALVAVEHRERQVLDVERDAVAEGEHQDQRTDEREGEADAVAQQLDHLTAGEGPDPGQRCRKPRCRARWPAAAVAGGIARSATGAASPGRPPPGRQ